MSNSVFDQVKLLYEQELYTSVASLVSLVITVIEHNPQLLSPADKFLIYVYYGDSLFQMRLFRRAEAIYRHALQFKKSVFKSKQGTKPNETARDLVSDVDIKYQLHVCYVELHQSEEAISILQSISAKQRTPKVNMALGKLFQQTGMERSAITAYKEVLRECPMALEAAEGLLSLGVGGAEVNSLILDANVTGMEWLNGWIKAHTHFHSRDYSQAIMSFKQLDERSAIRGNHALLVSLGKTYYYNGDSKMALNTLQRAHLVDPNNQRGLDILSALLANEKLIPEMERLVPVTWTFDEHGSAVWTALSYLLYANNNLSRAAYLAQKACCFTPRNVEALILKGKILCDLKKYQDAISPFREALKVAPYRFEPHQGLVDCYVSTHRLREASTIASNACKQLNNAPRALTLYASVLMKDPVAVCKAKSLLEKALLQDDSCLPAVYLLAEIHEQEMNLEGAVALLEKQVNITPTCRLHQMLGDLLGKLNEEAKAFDHYHAALSLEPNNARALEGMNRLDGIVGGTGRDAAYYNASDVDTSFVDNTPPSDHEDSSELST